MTDPDSDRVWSVVTERVAAAFGLRTGRSPTLKATIENGVQFVRVDESAREIVFDTQALTLGMLETGRPTPRGMSFQNSSTWLFHWLKDIIGESQVLGILDGSEPTPTAAVQGGLNQKFKVILSRSVNDLLPSARDFAQRTIETDLFEARHLIASMIRNGIIAKNVSDIFHHSLTAEENLALKRQLIDAIMMDPAPTEQRGEWNSILDIEDSNPAESRIVSAAGTIRGESRAEAQAIVIPADEITEIQSDRVAPDGPDLLGRDRDARAIARLICLPDAAPIAIGIFGGWGSGKSTFMAKLDREVEFLATRQANQRASASVATEPVFISRVIQMKFNAWQFVDANLWASLTAEFFDQLRAGGWNKAGKARHDWLVEKVNTHVHALTAEDKSARSAAAEANETLWAARQARDAAADEARKAGGKALVRETVDLLGDLYESQKSNLEKIGKRTAGIDIAATSERIRNGADEIVEIARNCGTVRGRLAAVWRALKFLRPWLIFGAILFVAGVVAFAFLQDKLHSWFVGGLLSVSGLGLVIEKVTPAFKFVRAVSKRAASFATKIGAADEAAVKELLAKEIHLRAAASNAEGLQQAADVTAKRLSRYVDPTGAPNPPRLLRYILEDDPNTQALTAEVGLIGRTRRLFQAVDDIVRAERVARSQRQDGDPDLSDRDVPDRIVLYIDDLDRCSEEQVYAVLQAVHLLLAFELFVVVVGVDVTWVHGALGKVLGDRTPKQGQAGDEDIEMASQQRSASYLEKIFQLAFWLNPLSRTPKGPGSYGDYVRTLASPPKIGDSRSNPAQRPSDTPPPAAAHESQLASSPTPTPDINPTPDEPGEKSAEQAAAQGPTEGLSVEASIRSMNLSDDEIEFLASQAIGAIASSTPRGVKRMVNIYRVVRSRLSEFYEHHHFDLDRDYPLIAVMAAIETGQPIQVADRFFRGLAALSADDEFLSEMSEALTKPTDRGSQTVGEAARLCPDLVGALKEATEIRGRQITVGELRNVARVVRRYSFNRST